MSPPWRRRTFLLLSVIAIILSLTLLNIFSSTTTFFQSLKVTPNVLVDNNIKTANATNTSSIPIDPVIPLEIRSWSSQQCQPIPAQLIQIISPSRVARTNVSTFLEGPGIAQLLGTRWHDNNESDAICQFISRHDSKHFPHAMQQLYRCWSWWRYNPTRRPVLLGPSDHRGFRHTLRQDFFTQLIELLQRQPNPVQLHVVHQNATQAEIDTSFRLLARPSFVEGDNFAFHSPDDAVALRRLVAERLSVDRIVSRDWTTGCPTTMKDSFPRIAILNRDERKSKRSILNAENLASDLQQKSSSTGPIPIVYFEKNRSLANQVTFFQNADIVISPHGAQLTGIPFLPTCGNVVEVFPKGYYMPYYFGSLARASGIRYHAIYVSQSSEWEKENLIGMKNQIARRQTRQANLCPETRSVVETITEIVEFWKECCSE